MTSSDTFLFTGSCFCKTVSLKIYALPRNSYLCHCQDCRRFTGTSFAHNLVFPARSVSLIISGKEQSAVIMTEPSGSQRDTAEGINSQLSDEAKMVEPNQLRTFGNQKDDMVKFCATCAGRVLITCAADNASMADCVIVPIGVIDDSETDAKLTPTAEFWCIRRESWMPAMYGTRILDKM